MHIMVSEVATFAGSSPGGTAPFLGPSDLDSSYLQTKIKPRTTPFPKEQRRQTNKQTNKIINGLVAETEVPGGQCCWMGHPARSQASSKDSYSPEEERSFVNNKPASVPKGSHHVLESI